MPVATLPNAAAAPVPERTGAELPFDEIWFVDFEFVTGDGGVPRPVCMVALELRSGREIRIWEDELTGLRAAPFDTGPRSVMVAYFASAEIGCFEALGWKRPANIIDLYAEFRVETNGLTLPMGRGLLGAQAYYDLGGMSAGDKESMRELIMGGGPWMKKKKAKILDYCAEDVRSMGPLLDAMAPRIAFNRTRLGQAVLRGRYMASVAAMEHAGIPVDTEIFQDLRERWTDIQDALIADVDREYGVYDGRSFKAALFAEWLARNGIPWPRLESGALALDDGTFRSMARAFPEVSALRELRHALSSMRLADIPVGRDGRNRTLLSPFRSKTGRNQPSNSRFLFGTSVWLRGLIKPAPGMGIAYLDFGSQEIAIAAALSGDARLWAAYASGDPYMAFAIDAGLAPPGATKRTHGAVRDRCKAIVLGVQYGMSAQGMASRAGLLVAEARELLQLHRETYRDFWTWAERNVNQALLGLPLTTPFGWRIALGRDVAANERSLLNWPMQSGGSDMMRLACTEVVRQGIRLCAPVHDALLIEAPLERLDEHVGATRDAMIRASSLVLGGPACKVDADVYRFPDRYMDEKRGATMWNKVMAALGRPLWTPPPGGAAS